MKTKPLFMLILSILIFHGCASLDKPKLVAVATSDQKTDPYGAVVSEKRYMVSISYYGEIEFLEDNAMFNIVVENGGEKPVNIGMDNISVIFEGNSPDWNYKKIHIQSLPEFMKDLKKDYYIEEYRIINNILRNAEQTALSIEQAINEFSAQASASSFEISLDNIVNEIDLMKKQYEQLEELAPDLILTELTIMPRKSISTLVSCDTSEIPTEIKGNFKVTVSIGGETHNFTFKHS